MPYVKAKSDNMKKVFLDHKKIKGINKSQKARDLGISRSLFHKYEKVGASLKTFKKRGLLDYIKEKNE